MPKAPKINIYNRLLKKLSTASAQIIDPEKIKETEDLLWDAFESLQTVEPYAYKDEDGKTLYDLSQYLQQYYLNEDNDENDRPYQQLEETIGNIINAIEERKNEYRSHSGLNFWDDTDDDTETESEGSGNEKEILTAEIIKQRINGILEEIDLNQDYYGIKNIITTSELRSSKWKTYLYLRKCVLAYRDGDEDELEQLLEFLESDNKNKQWLAEKLLDKSQKEAHEKWGSGQHEWLERSLIIDVLICINLKHRLMKKILLPKVSNTI